MSLHIKQENNQTELQKRIAADLREKSIRKSLDTDFEKPQLDNSKYFEGTKQTTSLAGVWLLLLIAAGIAIYFFIIFAK